jgi:acetyl-CoA synthetase
MHDTNLLEDQPIAWTPTPDVIERAQLTRFMKQVGVSTWDELYEFSIRDVEKFTEEVLKFLGIKFDPPYSRLLDVSEGIEFPKWFASPPRRGDAEEEVERGQQESEPGAVATGDSSPAGLNITTMCLDRWQTDEMKDQPAVIWEGEEGFTKTLSYAELLTNVEICSRHLVELGIRKGDAVGIHLPMIVETVVCLLAINRLGGIAVPVFSGYGIDAIASRMQAVGAKALFTCFGAHRRGKFFDMLTVSSKAVAAVASICAVIVIERDGEPLHTDFADDTDDAIRTQRIRKFHDELTYLSESVFPNREVRRWGVDYDYLERFHDPVAIEPTSAEDPLIILYTSGTTGKPKGIAHTHASFPIKAAQDMAFGTDVGRGTRICWYTDIGWMMGPWLIYGALINGATICIYDGAPDYPTHDRMWEFCAKHKVEVLGISPTLVRALAVHEEGSQQRGAETRPVGRVSSTGDEAVTQSPEKAKGDAEGTSDPTAVVPDQIRNPKSQIPNPHERHDLSSLRAFASTGEPWNPAPWWWLFEKVGNSKLPIINYSGGTEIAGGILMGNPLLPIKPCSFPAPCPGMDIDIFDENGKPVGPNQVGELVIKQPWIGMARGFWQETERYLDTYWRRFPNTWVHGDWAMRDKDGHWFILGRSDDTLKVAGKRVGPAEVESLLVAHPLVTEAAVIGVPDEAKGTAMVAFCVLSSVSSVPSVQSVVATDGTTENTEDTEATQRLEAELRGLVARDMGKPLAPSKIHFVSALPKTRNAKVMRRVLRSAYLGEDPGDLSALENPGAVDEIRSLSV